MQSISALIHFQTYYLQASTDSFTTDSFRTRSCPGLVDLITREIVVSPSSAHEFGPNSSMIQLPKMIIFKLPLDYSIVLVGWQSTFLPTRGPNTHNCLSRARYKWDVMLLSVHTMVFLCITVWRPPSKTLLPLLGKLVFIAFPPGQQGPPRLYYDEGKGHEQSFWVHASHRPWYSLAVEFNADAQRNLSGCERA